MSGRRTARAEGRSGLVTALVGNPKPRSRTYDAALRCATRVAELRGDPRVEAIDLIELGPRLFSRDDEGVQSALALVRASPVLVVASPTYKGTYTGLLKLLFDQIAAGELHGTLALPLMLGGAASHALAVDVHLRPLLVEVGCSCPTAGLFLLESELPGLEETLTAWLERWKDALVRRPT
jgi:FMN reductase